MVGEKTEWTRVDIEHVSYKKMGSMHGGEVGVLASFSHYKIFLWFLALFFHELGWFIDWTGHLLQLGHVDLLKDGLWALKAKLKELKAFDKALAANLLATKLKVKDLLVNHLDVVKKHHHKPAYDYGYQVRLSNYWKCVLQARMWNNRCRLWKFAIPSSKLNSNLRYQDF